MESKAAAERTSSGAGDGLQYRLKIALRDLEMYKDKVAELERQLAYYKAQVDTLTRDKALLEQQLRDYHTLLAAAKAERDEAIGEKFVLLTEANERSTLASSNARHSAVSEAGPLAEEQLFRARAEICQLKASLEDCLFERNEALRFLKVTPTQIRDDEIRQLNLYLEQNRPPAAKGLRTVISGQLSARGKVTSRNDGCRVVV